MRLALISDIHGNMEALGQAFADIGRCGVDITACLGDIIGYGPEPNEAIASVRERSISTVIGNHELAVIEPGQRHGFNPYARASLEKTIGLLTPSSRRFMRGLKSSLVIDDCRLVHGFPPDSPLIYASHTSDRQQRDAFGQLQETICFVGHTHLLEIIGFDGRRITRSPLPEGIAPLSRKEQYIIAAGSIGQPRDGNNRAKYLIWDSCRHTVEARFVPYDIKSVVDKMARLGLPEIHAWRLW